MTFLQKKSLFYVECLMALSLLLGTTLYGVDSDSSEVTKKLYPVRRLEMILQEICQEKGYRYRAFCDGWVIEIQKPPSKKIFRLLGYNFPLNDAVAAGLCNDKPALAAVLKAAEIAHVPHIFVPRPSLKGYIKAEGTWPTLQKALSESPGGLVIKPKDGTGGTDIFRVRSQRDLEEAVAFFYTKDRDFSISPLLEPIDEFRVVWLESPLLVLRKERLYVTGDGTSSVAQLVLDKKVNWGSLAWNELDPYSIPKKGKHILLQWQHNLGKGAHPRILEDTRAKIYQDVVALARCAIEVLGLKFCSVDIIREASGSLKVLEINSGVMLENVSAFLDRQDEVSAKKILIKGKGWLKAKLIYQKALEIFFNERLPQDSVGK